MGITWRHIPQAPSAGVSIDGRDPRNRVAVRVVKHTNGWRAYLRGNTVDGVDYGDVEAAKRAAETAWELAPEPPPRRERFGRRIPNQPDNWPLKH